jgi:GntR family transcriptional regulator/MocR family aminotransferase
VLELAMTFQVPIVESDLRNQRHVDAVPPPWRRAPDATGIVAYQGSTSRVLLPGLRIGWRVAPPGPLALLRAAKTVSDVTTATLPPPLAGHEFVVHARRRGVAGRPDAQFAPDGRGHGHVRFAFSGVAVAAAVTRR